MEALRFRKWPEVRDAIAVVSGKSVKTRRKWKCKDMKKVLSAMLVPDFTIILIRVGLGSV